MEDVIRVLPADVVDQIAAGEVIERPASVVKELVDNALDAGARTIAIDTAAGGKGLVRVTDDGCGMSPADARLALMPHATSKIRGFDDLWGLATMGFRGEALPSIASVSRLVLTTRRASDLAATRIEVVGGRVESVSEVGAAAGTTIEVTELLANVPARLKFLRGEATEASHVTELVGKVAMAHPHVHLRLRHNGRTALDTPPDRDPAGRARALLGARIASRMASASGEESGVRVTAFLAAPEHAQTTARGVQLFVGRRPVRDRGLLHALAMGYGELIPRGRYPVAVVLVDVAGGAVDVNVHPQKLEVRFADAGAVCAAVRHVVQAAVAAAPWRAEQVGVVMTGITSVAPPALPFDGPATPLAERYASQLRASRSGQLGFADTTPARTWVRDVQDKVRASRAAEYKETRKGYERAVDYVLREQRGEGWNGLGSDERDGIGDRTGESRRDASRDLFGRGTGSDEQGVVDRRGEARPDAAGDLFADGSGRVGDGREPEAGRDERGREPGDDGLTDVDGELGTRVALGSGGAAAARAWGATPAVESARGYFARLRYLGQLDLTYFVCEADGELVLVDQHAAHERVELARLYARGNARNTAVQRMLFPVTVDASADELAMVDRSSDVLAQVGFEVEPFGKATLAIKAVPAGIRHGEPAAILRGLLASWQGDGAPGEAERLQRALSAIACHSVVRAGDRLAASEAESLLQQLDGAFAADIPDPHGRPVLLRLPIAELARRFGR